MSPAVGGGGDGFGPYTECGDDVVIQAADEGCNNQHTRLRLSAGGVAADEHLCRGCRFGKWILAMHVLDEVASEGYEE